MNSVFESRSVRRAASAWRGFESFVIERLTIWTLAGMFALVVAITFSSTSVFAQETSDLQAIEQAFQTETQPLLQRYCYECHENDLAEAELDLESFATFADVRKQPQAWKKVVEMLDSGQMPPKGEPQPTDAERTRMRKWVRSYLVLEATASAGDPGAVVLRRLSNSEYTYTLRDLTGIDTLDPAREFPIDGAAGEGFTNTGSALVMSPALITKYLDAGKEVSAHAVLLPDGMRFSRYATRRDWTDEVLAEIREFYREFTDNGGGSSVNLQGIQFDTNQGGRLPLENYLAATLAERDALIGGKKSLADVARERNLNARYLNRLWEELTANPNEKRSLLLDEVRTRWRDAKKEDAAAITVEIANWQQALWKFNSIGHIGREGGPKAWMEAVSPLIVQQELRLKLPAADDGEDIVLYLTAGDAGDGNEADYAVWSNPRLEQSGLPPLPLRDVAGLQERLAILGRETLKKTAAYLAAAAEAGEQTDLKELANKHNVDAGMLKVWLSYLQIGGGAVEVKGHFTEKLPKGANYEFINGWGSPSTPSITANSSDQEVRIPGIARPHSIVAHPSPTLFVAAGWRSPINGVVRVEAKLADAHPECGNGVEWVIQHRSGNKMGNLWQGEFETGASATMTAKTIPVREGELVSFILGPRQGNHSCDLTEINLVITETGGDKRVWDLAKDVSPNIMESNPHADGYGNKQTWHFYQGLMSELQKDGNIPATVPAGSLLALWQEEKDANKRRELAGRIQAMAVGEPPGGADSPDAVLFQQLQKLASPQDVSVLLGDVKPDERFGKHPIGQPADAADLVVRAPSTVEFRIPAKLAAGRELVVNGRLETEHGREGSVQLQVSTTKPENRGLIPGAPIVVAEDSKARAQVELALKEFRNLFPPALCYTKIVPVDEVVTLTLFYREDDHLIRLMLDDKQTAQLNQLWDELFFVSQEPFALVVAFEQISEFATQDRPDLVKAFAPLRQPINDRADAFRQRLVNTEPNHLEAVIRFADKAWRRELNEHERQGLRDLYALLRKNEIGHEEAIRLTLARVLTSPAFLYKSEEPAPGKTAEPVTNLELANRLSYFLWSSMPDEELRATAEEGKLIGGDDQTNNRDTELLKQTRRMLKDPRTRRLAVQFACQWLHVRDFDQNADKNENLYPEFETMRREMYEETVRFFEDMFRNDGSVMGLWDADYTFVNEPLAKLYGIDGVSGPEWRRIDGLRDRGRGGILGMATILASQSGASRTSPILRGNWVSETLLGERLPRPPANVPTLPETVPTGLTARQLIEQHSSVAECAKCHARIDPYGFALEQFDAIGRLRPEKADTKTKLLDGKAIEGIGGLRDYLVKDRHDDILRQFCRKLLGYSLGREVQFSDELLLAEMQRKLEANDYRFSAAVEAIVLSDQFQKIRGKLFE